MTDRPDYAPRVAEYLTKFGLRYDKDAAHCLAFMLMLAHEEGVKEGINMARNIWTQKT